MSHLKHLLYFFWFHIRWFGRLKFCFSDVISEKCSFEGANKIEAHSSFCGQMGYGSYIGVHCEIEANIGRFCSIAPHVITNHGTHPYTKPYATTSPMFFSLRKQNGRTFAKQTMFNEFKKIPTIGNDCWIGSNVFIAGDVNIGDGAVVLAGSVVTKDVPPYAIVSGIPGRVKKYRYDDETIEFLLKTKWWEKDIKWLKENWMLLNDIEKLKDALG